MSQPQILTPQQLTIARRRFLQTAMAGMAGASVLGLARGGFAAPAATDDPPTDGLRKTASGKRDQDILNFALNLEYLEAEFYLFAVSGVGLTDDDSTSDVGAPVGTTTGGAQVAFATAQISDLANEIADDELAHVRLLRTVTKKTVARPSIDLSGSFTAAAKAAGLIGPDETFDPYANENNFLLAAFIFEDVGVTAYRGAAPFIANKTYLSAAAGILAVEAYHAGAIRTLLATRSTLIANEGSVQPQVTIGEATNAISALRDSVDGDADSDQGILNDDGTFNIVPTDADGLAFARTPGEVSSIVFGGFNATKGSFLPDGINGRLEGIAEK